MGKIIRDIEENAVRLIIKKNIIGYQIEIYENGRIIHNFKASRNNAAQTPDAYAYFPLTSMQVAGVLEHDDYCNIELTMGGIITIRDN